MAAGLSVAGASAGAVAAAGAGERPVKLDHDHAGVAPGSTPPGGSADALVGLTPGAARRGGAGGTIGRTGARARAARARPSPGRREELLARANNSIRGGTEDAGRSTS